MGCTVRCCSDKLLQTISKTYIRSPISQYDAQFCPTGLEAHLTRLTGYEAFNGTTIDGNGVLLKGLAIAFNYDFEIAVSHQEMQSEGEGCLTWVNALKTSATEQPAKRTEDNDVYPLGFRLHCTSV